MPWFWIPLVIGLLVLPPTPAPAGSFSMFWTDQPPLPYSKRSPANKQPEWSKKRQKARAAKSAALQSDAEAVGRAIVAVTDSVARMSRVAN